MTETAKMNGYSAEVRLELRVEGKVFDIARVGPNQFVPRNPIELQPRDAEVAMFVDADFLLWPVRLPFGAWPFDKKVVTAARGEMLRAGPVIAN